MKVLNSHIDFCQPLRTQVSINKITSGNPQAQSGPKSYVPPYHVTNRLTNIKNKFPHRNPAGGFRRNNKDSQPQQHQQHKDCQQHQTLQVNKHQQHQDSQQQHQMTSTANKSLNNSDFTPTIMSTPTKDDNIGSRKARRIVTFNLN